MKIENSTLVVLSICIVTYGKRKDDVYRALKSIFDYIRDLRHEVILVDNGSTDDTVKMVFEEFPSVNVIHQNENMGYAPAMNLALGKSKGTYVLCLSLDAEILPNSVRTLITFMGKHPKCGLAGPQVVNGNGEVLTTRHHPNLLLSVWGEIIPIKVWLRKNRLLRRVATFLFRNASGLTSDYKQAKKVRVLSGGILLSSRELLNDVGLLDGNMPLGPDDYDWCYRAIQRGYEVWYVAGSKMIHRQKPKEDPCKLSPINLFSQLPSLLYFYQKNHKGFKLFLFRASILLLLLKWKWKILCHHGANSVQYKAVEASKKICLNSQRYLSEVVADWPQKCHMFSLEKVI